MKTDWKLTWKLTWRISGAAKERPALAPLWPKVSPASAATLCGGSEAWPLSREILGNVHHQRWIFWELSPPKMVKCDFFHIKKVENDNSSSSNSGDLPLSKMVRHWYVSIIQNGELTSECILKCSNFHRQMMINHETLQTLSRSSQMIQKLLPSWTLLCMWII